MESDNRIALDDDGYIYNDTFQKEEVSDKEPIHTSMLLLELVWKPYKQDRFHL